MGYGDAPDGSDRICIAIGGTPINPEIAEQLCHDGDERTMRDLNWRALTVDAARTLYELLRAHFDPRFPVPPAPPSVPADKEIL